MKTILVVDDDAEIVWLLCSLLSTVGYRTLSAADVAEARCQLCSGTPVDAVVIDYRLPDGTGLDLIDWMRQCGGPCMPTVLMSGDLEPDGSEMDFSGCEFLLKPFLSVDLLAALARAIGGGDRAQGKVLGLALLNQSQLEGKTKDGTGVAATNRALANA